MRGDGVFDPAAGGSFERVLNSVLAPDEKQIDEQGGDEMTEKDVGQEGAVERLEEMERAQCAHPL